MASKPSCDKSFCSDYMLLNTEDASLLELGKILFSSDIGKRKFVDCPEETRPEPFGRRWIIFISVLAQKFLRSVSNPLAGFGAGIEYWLNLLSENGGFFSLLIKSLKGNLRRPEKNSSTFTSFNGKMDGRLELDSKIRHDDKRYHSALCVMAAKASYENKNYIQNIVTNHWKMKHFGSYDFWNDYQSNYTTQAFVFEDKDVIVVAFRGTEAFDGDAWSSNFDLSWYDLPDAGKIHGGFMKALGMQKSVGWPKEQPQSKPETAYYFLRKLLKQRLQMDEKAKFILTGHSQGGALAALFPAILAFHEESWLLERLEAVYTFGQPRVGDERFGKWMMQTLQKHKIDFYRIVYSNDIVPRLPYDDSTLMFKHFGSCLYYNSCYEGKIVDEEPNKNYFSLLWLIPKILNAWWELIRSFTISCTKGSEFKEGNLLRMVRVMGLLVAGVSAHSLQDYVNTTRLGSSEVFLPMVD